MAGSRIGRDRIGCACPPRSAARGFCRELPEPRPGVIAMIAFGMLGKKG
jgi:hypothetical protein